MDEFGLTKDVTDFIVGTADDMDISKVILFGSRAKNTFSPKSDIDLAILGSDYHAYVEAFEQLIKDLENRYSEELLETF